MKARYMLAFLFIIGLSLSCTTKIIQVEPDAKKIMETLQGQISMSVEKIRPGLVFAELSSGKKEISMTALVISADGQIFLPTELKKDSSDRITVWVNDKEYEASLVKSDSRAKMSIVKIENEMPLTPVAFTNAYDIQPAQMIAGLVNSGVNNDFKIYVDIGFARGISDDGEYDELEVMGMPANKGAVIINLDGEIVAWQTKNSGGTDWIVSNEVQKSFEKLQAKAGKDGTETDGDEKKGKPWLGFTWAPINEDYAELMDLPKKSVVIRHVIKDSPLEKAGAQDSDLIVEVDERPFTKRGTKALQAQFVKFVRPEMDRKISFKLLRGDKYLTIETKFAKKPEPKEFRAEDIGVRVQEVTDADVYNRGLFVNKGVIINGIVPGSPAGTVVGRSYLVHRDDVIVELNKTPVNNIEEFITIVETIRREQLTIILMKVVGSGGHTSYVALNLKNSSR